MGIGKRAKSFSIPNLGTIFQLESRNTIKTRVCQRLMKGVPEQ